MEAYLYQDLEDLETKHWWHLAKRKTVIQLVKKFSAQARTSFSLAPSPKILDVGCGTGQNLQTLKKFGSVWGIDSEAYALKLCRKKGLKNIHQATAENTKLDDNFFDIATALDVLEHTDDQKTVAEMRRILRSGGLLIITVPTYQWLWSRWDEVLHHKRRYTKVKLVKLLREHGFRVIFSSYIYSFLVIPVLIIRVAKQLFYQADYPSDFKISSPLLNSFFGKLADIERKLTDYFPIPFGTTLVCVARKI